MFRSIKSLFKELLEGEDLSGNNISNPELAMAALLCEVAAADSQVEADEEKAKLALLMHLLNIEEEKALSLIEQAKESIKNSVSLYDFTTQLRELEQSARFELVKAMWEVANADGRIDPLEDAVIRKVAELLYVDHSEFIRAKLSVIKN
ncbi:tellurite resistance TerB family protein [Vibrio algarum]|uniref:TerB family tellurite resistance protein n=1 Tax=Vibrio algarum TaxID=3020714 RepID=A0ABT4YQV8_9VIBR|nr:TerB family tellurite resistance protein [Vibrio sp. KJ40-1]MDB1123782.1 TerB family tellurite resistance protein [Vibrio sp. KJ40-1]